MIKKLLLSGSLAVLSSPLFAQIDTKLNLTGLAGKKIELSAEAGHDKLGLELTLGYQVKKWSEYDLSGEEVVEDEVSGNGIIAGFRANYYLKPKTTLNGFYLSPYTQYNRNKIAYTNGPEIFTKASAGLIFGYKGHIYEQLFWSVESGGGYNFIYQYVDAKTKQKVDGEESIPFFGNLTKINLQFRASIIYRIGQQ